MNQAALFFSAREHVIAAAKQKKKSSPKNKVRPIATCRMGSGLIYFS